MDELLIDRLRAGDRQAADTLVESYFDDLYRFFRHLTRDPHEAEDLAQQTLLRALHGIKGFDGRSRLRTWLHGIAYREFLNWQRGRRILLALDPRRPHVETGFEAFADRERLLDAIGRLSTKLRTVFLMAEVQELALEEVAAALVLPIGTVKSRLHEARHRLRQMLADPELETAHASETV
ncbi:sigma-70 family RNA polymerase sigma factor [bacterium]|nr:MAG: sigma-70 family RNA polymerase sigma factor [bacterium]